MREAYRKNMYSIIDPKDEDAIEYIKYFNDISKGFQCKKDGRYFNSEDYSYATIERGDIKRVKWLKDRNVRLYKVLKKENGVNIKIEEI